MGQLARVSLLPEHPQGGLLGGAASGRAVRLACALDGNRWLVGDERRDRRHRIQCVIFSPGVSNCSLRVPRTAIWYRHDVEAWLNARREQAAPRPDRPDRMAGHGRSDDGRMALEDFVDLKLDHHTKDGIEIVDVEGEIDVYTAPRLRELLIELVNNGYYQLVVNMEKVEFLDSTGLGVLVGGLKRVRAHDGSLDLVCTQERILKIFRITGLTKVFGIHDTVDEAITARKAEK
jgi:anti-sigma B factor antagonist